MTTDIHGEKRFTSTIARRLGSLGALTRGERRAAGDGLFRAEDNLESPWAHRALQAFYVALEFGHVEAMSRAVFEDKTGLRLTDHQGNLKASDDMPPMNTFLNRLLALRISDQNALFAAFDEILSSILERAQACGPLDRGMEDNRAAFTVLGCFVEVIAYTPRVFVPTDQPDVLTAILAEWPAQTILPRAA